MRILITGGNGYIGSLLVKGLNKHRKEYDHKVQVYDLPSDIGNFKLPDCDVVIHLAAMRLPAANANPEEAKRVNVEGTARVVEALNGQHLIYASTCSCYGIQSNVADEDSQLNPVDSYGRTKLEAEDYVRKASRYTIFRFSTVYGRSPNMRWDTLVNSFVQSAKRREPIVVKQGDTWRPFVHIRDILRAIRLAISGVLPNDTFNVGGENITKIELAKTVAKFFPTQVIEEPNSADTRSYRVSFDKINKFSDWSSKYTLQDGMKDFLDEPQKSLETGQKLNSPA